MFALKMQDFWEISSAILSNITQSRKVIRNRHWMVLTDWGRDKTINKIFLLLLYVRRHFTDDSFKYISLNESVEISIKISLGFVPRGPVNNIPALVG